MFWICICALGHNVSHIFSSHVFVDFISRFPHQEMASTIVRYVCESTAEGIVQVGAGSKHEVCWHATYQEYQRYTDRNHCRSC